MIGCHLTVILCGEYSFKTWNSHDPATNIPRIEEGEINKYFSKDLLIFKEIEQI